LRQFAEYVSLDQLAAESDVITSIALTPETYHSSTRVAQESQARLHAHQHSRCLIDTRRRSCLKTERLGSLGMDVYEEEENLFFETSRTRDSR